MAIADCARRNDFMIHSSAATVTISPPNRARGRQAEGCPTRPPLITNASPQGQVWPASSLTASTHPVPGRRHRPGGTDAANRWSPGMGSATTRFGRWAVYAGPWRLPAVGTITSRQSGRILSQRGRRNTERVTELPPAGSSPVGPGYRTIQDLPTIRRRKPTNCSYVATPPPPVPYVHRSG